METASATKCNGPLIVRVLLPETHYSCAAGPTLIANRFLEHRCDIS